MEQNFESHEQVVNQATDKTTEHENAQKTIMMKPNDNMLLAILTTVCCCLPFGIVAIIKASQVNSLFAMKQYAAAQVSAEEAKKWSYIGIGLGLVFGIIYLFIGFARVFSNNL
ncbi:CD225/dispanin family protein [Segatella paludivivens]|uniref:CD225/dispanin family protein n=1 Tax=Segatella paludivivens TaxID=185294 RepID=UPI0003616836|nr:CD225/dispanin family protein [Segatella paludivivens]